mgnify:CR=1 FL=1
MLSVALPQSGEPTEILLTGDIGFQAARFHGPCQVSHKHDMRWRHSLSTVRENGFPSYSGD